MRLCAIALAAVVFSVIAMGALSAQTPAQGDAEKNRVVMTELSAPTYPPLARQTRITGSVQLEVKVLKNGDVYSAEVLSGHPLLQQAAIESAKRSKFACYACSEGLTSYTLLYTFELDAPAHCCSDNEKQPSSQEAAPFPHVTRSENQVTVIDMALCICDPAGTIGKVRSLKCLFLWPCGYTHRW